MSKVDEDIRRDFKRVQDHAFTLAEDYAELHLAARRTMRALEGYWEVWEIHGGRMEAWWGAFEKWRGRLEIALVPRNVGVPRDG